MNRPAPYRIALKIGPGLLRALRARARGAGVGVAEYLRALASRDLGVLDDTPARGRPKKAPAKARRRRPTIAR